VSRKSGYSSEAIAAARFDLPPGFLNRGCAIQEYWKSIRNHPPPTPLFPRLPQPVLKPLCKPHRLCENRVHRRMKQGFQRYASSTEDALPHVRHACNLSRKSLAYQFDSRPRSIANVPSRSSTAADPHSAQTPQEMRNSPKLGFQRPCNTKAEPQPWPST
jgi:hypothetical protein